MVQDDIPALSQTVSNARTVVRKGHVELTLHVHSFWHHSDHPAHDPRSGQLGERRRRRGREGIRHHVLALAERDEVDAEDNEVQRVKSYDEGEDGEQLEEDG